MTTTLSTEVLVIGSGAGGAVTAATLAEAGREVTLLEEGPHLDAGDVQPYSQEEMLSKYRHGGVNATIGLPPISYVEGRCVGGGTEINSGLYHRTPPDIVESWSRGWDIDGLDADGLGRYAAEIEETLGVELLPEPAPEASAVIDRGARQLGWQVTEVPRVYRHSAEGPPRQQTMTRTFIPRAVAAGATLVPDCRVRRLSIRRGHVRGALCEMGDDRRALRVDAEHVFVCAGAIGTPALLQRSGVRHNIGSGLKLHPTIKLAAEFPEPLADHGFVPMHQVKQFAPDITLGGSVFRPGYVALALGEAWEANAPHMDRWPNIAVYYASIRSDGGGRVWSVPGASAPIVTYLLTAADVSRLARGLVHVAELVLAGGAVRLFPSVDGAPPIERMSDVGRLWSDVSRRKVSLMTIHLFSSVGMGQRRDITGADSFGRVWSIDNLRVNDASLLPDAPGVNPQGTIMAIARRNCDQFLSVT